MRIALTIGDPSGSSEIRAGTLSKSQEIVLLRTFARRVCVTRQMLVNDDLGAVQSHRSIRR